MVKIIVNNIKFDSNELWPLLNILNEICYGINIPDFENSIGVKKQKIVDFMDRISKEDEKNDVVLNLNDEELIFLQNSFKEIFKQIDEWEFQTRIGISIQEANKIKHKLK